jgi:hypothetical protein
MSAMTSKPSIWKAALIAPLGVPLSITFSIVWESVAHLGLSGLRDVSIAILFVFLFGLPISYGIMLLLGLPYLFWLRSRGWLTWMFVCIGAVVLGAAMWAGYWQLSLSPPPLTRTIPAGALIGFVVGVIFSLVAKLPKRVV